MALMRVWPSDFDGRDGKKSLGSKPGTFEDGSRREQNSRRKGLIQELKV